MYYLQLMCFHIILSNLIINILVIHDSRVLFLWWRLDGLEQGTVFPVLSLLYMFLRSFILLWIEHEVSRGGSCVWMLGVHLVTLCVEVVDSLWLQAWLVVMGSECFSPSLQAELSASWSTESLGAVTSYSWCCR